MIFHTRLSAQQEKVIEEQIIASLVKRGPNNRT